MSEGRRIRPQAFTIAAFMLLSGACDPKDDPGTDEPPAQPGPSAYFAPDVDHPERSLLPRPNLLAIDSSRQPAGLELSDSQCAAAGSASAQTLEALEALAGFASYGATGIHATFGAPVDPDSAAGRVVLVDMGPFAAGRDDPAALDPAAAAAEPLPVALAAGWREVALEGCAAEPTALPSLEIQPYDTAAERPLVLAGDRRYGVGLLDGIASDSGQAFQPFYLWNRIRAAEPIEPDTDSGQALLDSLALAELQQLHRPLLDALEAAGHPRQEVLLAWSFHTQPTTAALAHIAERLGSYGPDFDSTAVAVPADSLPVPPLPAPQFLAAIGSSCAAIGAGPDCPGIDRLISGQFVSPRFQTRRPLPQRYAPTGAAPVFVPGRFDSPRRPAPQGGRGQTVAFLASTPAGVEGPYPVVIFAHPLPPADPQQAASVNKLSLLAVANALGTAGMGAVAIDLPLSGDRAIAVVDGLTERQVLYPILDADARVARDNLRQAAVDLLQLERVLADCSPADCGGLAPDPERIFFAGSSLGAVAGSLALAFMPRVERAVLNAPAAGLGDTLAASPVLLAELAPALCASGAIAADCCAEPAGCDPPALADDAGLARFATAAQWMLDPADPVAYAGRLGEALAAGELRLMIQLVDGDDVFPEAGGRLLAELVGLDADGLRSYDPGACAQQPGAAHGMLLADCGAGSRAMQADLIAFLLGP